MFIGWQLLNKSWLIPYCVFSRADLIPGSLQFVHANANLETEQSYEDGAGQLHATSATQNNLKLLQKRLFFLKKKKS